MLTKLVLIDKIEILEDGTIQLREKTKVIEDGVVLAATNTDRRVIVPGGDATGESVEVQSLVSLIHTPERVEAYLAQKAINEANSPEHTGA